MHLLQAGSPVGGSRQPPEGSSRIRPRPDSLRGSWACVPLPGARPKAARAPGGKTTARGTSRNRGEARWSESGPVEVSVRRPRRRWPEEHPGPRRREPGLRSRKTWIERVPRTTIGLASISFKVASSGHPRRATASALGAHPGRTAKRWSTASSRPRSDRSGQGGSRAFPGCSPRELEAGRRHPWAEEPDASAWDPKAPRRGPLVGKRVCAATKATFAGTRLDGGSGPGSSPTLRHRDAIGEPLKRRPVRAIVR